MRPIETFETLEDHPLSYRTGSRTGSGTLNYNSNPNLFESSTKPFPRTNTHDLNYSPDSQKTPTPSPLQDQLLTLQASLCLEKSAKEKTQDDLIASLQTIEKNLAHLQD